MCYLFYTCICINIHALLSYLNNTLNFRSQELCASTKVFIASNFVKEQFLCYLLPLKNQLICVELEHSETITNDVILGNVTVIFAKDAAYLPVIINYILLLFRSTIIILNYSQKI